MASQRQRISHHDLILAQAQSMVHDRLEPIAYAFVDMAHDKWDVDHKVDLYHEL